MSTIHNFPCKKTQIYYIFRLRVEKVFNLKTPSRHRKTLPSTSCSEEEKKKKKLGHSSGLHSLFEQKLSTNGQRDLLNPQKCASELVYVKVRQCIQEVESILRASEDEPPLYYTHRGLGAFMLVNFSSSHSTRLPDRL